MNKRGMAPLVATLLLIAFAVALGVVIMNFGRAQVEMEAECTINIGLKFSEVGEEEQFCLDKASNQLFFIVENGINIKVEGLVINIIGSKKAVTYDLGDAKIEKAGAYMKYVPYDVNEIGELRQIKIIPKVVMYEEELICREKAIVMEKIRDCTV
jgi:flagellin-like protein